MQQLFTADERTVQLGYAGSVARAFGVALPATRSLSLLIALAAMLALHLFLRHTYAGKAIRAVAEDGEGAALVGIDRRRVHRLTLGLGAALAGVAGSLVVVGYGVDPGGGLTWTLKAVVVLTLAGSGSVLGAFPAGLLLGLVEAVSGMALGATWREVAGLVVFLLVLVLPARRPVPAGVAAGAGRRGRAASTAQQAGQRHRDGQGRHGAPAARRLVTAARAARRPALQPVVIALLVLGAALRRGWSPVTTS